VNLVCLVFLACVASSDPGDSPGTLSCSVVSAQCASLSAASEEKLRKDCASRSTCREVSPKIFATIETAPRVVERKI
jgi:hypothetical protein